MATKTWRVQGMASLLVLALLCGARAADEKATDEGPAEKFKGKTFKLKEKEEVKITLEFPEGRTAILTVRSAVKTDVNLFVYDADNTEVAKDDSPGPNCDIKFTPKKGGKYTLKVVNNGKGPNKSKLTVIVKKK
jgi:hypothetical protein